MLRMILSLTLVAAAARAQPGEAQSLRRVVALLDYVAGDYARAVGEHGEVLSQAEHVEQIGFVEDAARELRADVNGRGEDLARRLDALRKQVADRAPPAEVARGARGIRDEIVQRFNVILLPLPPAVSSGPARRCCPAGTPTWRRCRTTISARGSPQRDWARASRNRPSRRCAPVHSPRTSRAPRTGFRKLARRCAPPSRLRARAIALARGAR